MSINWMLPVNKTGYGVVGLNIIKSAIKQDKDSVLYLIGHPEMDQIHYQDVFSALKNQENYDSNNPSFNLFHASQLAYGPSRKIWSGMTFFEIDKLRKNEIAALNSLDVIFACGEWAKNIMEENGVKPQIKSVKLGVDQNIFYKSRMINTDETIFINCGKWEIRKGHDVLLQAFLRAFNKDDNVKLLMINDSPLYSQKEINNWRSYYKNHELSDKVVIINRVETQEELAQIFANVHCGVFPTRGEGWNLECAELLAMGKHVITTRCTAQTEFCNDDNSFLIDVNEKEPAICNKWFDGFGNWYKIGEKQIDEIAERMRHVHKLRINGQLKENLKGVETISSMTYDDLVKNIMETCYSYV